MTDDYTRDERCTSSKSFWRRNSLPMPWRRWCRGDPLADTKFKVILNQTVERTLVVAPSRDYGRSYPPGYLRGRSGRRSIIDKVKATADSRTSAMRGFGNQELHDRHVSAGTLIPRTSLPWKAERDRTESLRPGNLCSAGIVVREAGRDPHAIGMTQDFKSWVCAFPPLPQAMQRSEMPGVPEGQVTERRTNEYCTGPVPLETSRGNPNSPLVGTIDAYPQDCLPAPTGSAAPPSPAFWTGTRSLLLIILLDQRSAPFHHGRDSGLHRSTKARRLKLGTFGIPGDVAARLSAGLRASGIPNAAPTTAPP